MKGQNCNPQLMNFPRFISPDSWSWLAHYTWLYIMKSSSAIFDKRYTALSRAWILLWVNAFKMHTSNQYLLTGVCSHSLQRCSEQTTAATLLRALRQSQIYLKQSLVHIWPLEVLLIKCFSSAEVSVELWDGGWFKKIEPQNVSPFCDQMSGMVINLPTPQHSSAQLNYVKAISQWVADVYKLNEKYVMAKCVTSSHCEPPVCQQNPYSLQLTTSIQNIWGTIRDGTLPMASQLG